MTEHKYKYNDYSCFAKDGVSHYDNTIPSKPIAVDLETTGLDPKKDRICYLSLCFKHDESWVFSWPMKDGSLGWLMNPVILKVFHHAKFDIVFLERAGYVVNNFMDTQLMAYHWDNRNSAGASSLKSLAKKYLKVEETTEFKDLLPTKDVNKGKTILDVPIERVIPYAGDDAIYTYGLYCHFGNAITDLEKTEEKQVSDNLQLDVRISTVIKQMMTNGCKLDTTRLLQMQSDCTAKLAEYATILRKWIPATVNMNSTKQMQDLLYCAWKLPVVEFTDKGGFSVDDAALKVLEKKHPAIPFLREYRFQKKLQSTYLEPFAERTADDGFLYGDFNQIMTITGRLSSSNPNLQNIPVKNDLGKELRKCWISRFPGGKLVVCDHSQIEMRVMAHFSGDRELIRVINDGKDLHTATGCALFGTEEPTAAQRTVGKTINFGTIYGMGPNKLAASLGISLTEAQEYLAAYFNVYRGVKDYMYSQQAFAETNGYVETLLGRRLYIHEYDYTGTRAVNYPIQGSAAEILKLGMVQMAKFISSQSNRAKLILQVHDELVIDCPGSDVDVYEKYAEEVMLEALPKLKVPLAVDVKVVDSWGEAK